jgi:hypothetical protein
MRSRLLNKAVLVLIIKGRNRGVIKKVQSELANTIEIK